MLARLLKRARALTGATALLALAASAAQAQPQPTAAAPMAHATLATPAPLPSAVPAPVATPGHALTAADVDAFMDGFMPNALNTAQTPGAVVVVVKDGHVLFEKGYGYSDYAGQKPVDPRLTLFRPGSVSKLFTWTAVMQQVEAGKIDLDADVNRYLDFHIPAFRGVPVTMRELMTHRAGFSETARDLLTFGKAPPPLDEVLKRYVPPRIFGPADGPGYSNYGASLAGYIVQRVSGEPFDDYIGRHIFAPLGMAHSTFAQPLPPALAPEMSVGYLNWSKPGQGFEIISMPPAGALSSTGDDMAKFMIAHLQLGRYGTAQILQPATAQAMHTTAWKAFPDLNGNLLGFYQQNVNGHRVIAHGGDTDYFHSDLSLFIDDGVGLFVSVNAPGRMGIGEFIRDGLFHAFADRYFPATAPAPASTISPETAKAHARLIAGQWITTRRSDSTFLDLISVLQPTVVTANADGSISVAPLGVKETFVEVSPFLWRQLNGPDRLQAIFVNGRVQRWGADSSAPIWVYVRPTGLGATGLAAPLAIASLVFIVLVALLWPVNAIVRARYRAKFAYAGARAWAYRVVRLAAIVAVAAIVAWVVALQEAASTSGADVRPLIHLAQTLSVFAFVGGLAAAVWNLVVVFRTPGAWVAKAFAILTLLAFAYMLIFALSYHLMGVSGQF